MCFYQEIFSFSIALDSLDCTGFSNDTSKPEFGTHDARLENKEVHCTLLCQVYLFE